MAKPKAPQINWDDEKEIKNIVVIDRSQEDEAVEHFQKTGDLATLEAVYRQRIPTIKSWANKHYYPGLTFSVDDLFEDLSVVFVKAAEKYDRSRGTFNTCLFNFLLNRLKNIKNSKHAKKRKSDEYQGPAIGMILSLDYEYNADDGAEVTLKDIIPANNPTETDYVLTNMYMEEALDVLSHNNPEFKEFLSKIGEGSSLVSLIRQYKTKKGSIKVSPVDAKRFRTKKCNKMVSTLLKDKKITKEDFTLLGYEVDSKNRLRYEIELKKTKETDQFMRSLRELRKNKEFYREKIKG
ncbi:MAG: hypothetical protein WC119_02935 [Synergistaceae bacterium]